jgi:hypothetical protein
MEELACLVTAIKRSGISDDQRVTQKLPKSYDNFVEQIGIQNKDLTLEELRNMLRDVTDRRNYRAAQVPGNSGGGSAYAAQPATRAVTNNRPGEKPNNWTCNYCKETGHFIAECPIRPK